MTSERWQKAKELFADALEIPIADRDAFLTRCCDGDADLRREIESLLDGDQRAAGKVLDVGPPVELLQAAMMPETVGPYRILEILGEGGMGTVYLAEQSRPVQRRVALKLIKLGMDTGQVLSRFEAERQALARMEHDCIAKVFDAGTADSGQPYFVMEHVAGTAITDWCDENRLTTRERLELFVEVCAGVQHAHHKGVIHRDLKPSNILVSRQGGRAVPKVIDFGVAKAIGSDELAGTMLTEHGQMVGTPEYMAPEQAEVTSAHVDTRSDVYALGVILFEMLCGELPFATDELRGGSWFDLQRQILEREPRKPSTRIRRSGQANELRGELDWIVMKTLQNEREERYSSPLELARDIGRYLAHEPVEAGPPSKVYRLRKFVRRNRLQVIAATAVLVTLLAGMVSTTAYMFEAESRLEDFNRLASVVKLGHARAVAAGETLYPAHPDRVDAMRTWITQQGEPLARELPRLEKALATMRRDALAPTDADRDAWAATHPRAPELTSLRRQLTAQKRAAAVRRGQLALDEHRFHDPIPDDAAGLNQMAWWLVTPDESEREWGREVEGLALARRAWQRAQDAADRDQRARVASTLAFALLACGIDNEAMAMAKTAVATADEARKEHFAAQLQRVQDGITNAGDNRGDDAIAAVEVAITKLGAELGQRRSWRFEAPSDQFLHDSLARLADELEEFVAPETGELARVRERLRWAESVHQRTVLDHASAWLRARDAIAAADGEPASTRYAARPLDLLPQIGLVPIGANPATGLWEFYHPRSAADPDRIPQHDAAGNIDVTDDTGIVFVLIPGGAFLMGAQCEDPTAPNHDPGAKPHEAPRGMAIEPFFLARHELTQGQWHRLSRGRHPSSQGVGWDRPDDAAPPVTLAHPVEHVTWGGSQLLLSHHGLELPAEAQWEFACRAGETTPWFTGAEPSSLAGYANILDKTAAAAVSQWGRPEDFDDGYIVHAPVGTFRPNTFGLFDMHGNVWEFCRGADAETGSYIVRGGSFMGGAEDARSAMRMACQTSTRSSKIGVRAARRVTQ